MPTVLEKVRQDHPALKDYRKEQAALDRQKDAMIARQLDIIANANKTLALLGYNGAVCPVCAKADEAKKQAKIARAATNKKLNIALKAYRAKVGLAGTGKR